jgi:hypothetical protein
MDKMNQRPTGETGGNDIPDRGVRTGVTDTYGGNMDQGYNSGGGISSATRSDAPDQCKSSRAPRINGKGA